MASILSLEEAVAELVRDGDTVAFEGFTHLIPFAAGHEIIRQKRRDLTLIRLTLDLIYDQMRASGCASKSGIFVGWKSGRRLDSSFPRRGGESVAPGPLEIEEHEHAGMAAAFSAGAANLPFGILRGYLGTELAEHTQVTFIECPFTGERLAAIPALRPDVAIIHAQKADRKGNVWLWGVVGVQKEAVLAAKRAIALGGGNCRRAQCAHELRGSSPLGGERRVRSAARCVSFLCARVLSARQRLL